MPPCCSHRREPTTQETTSNSCASNTFIIYVFNYISIPTSMRKTEKFKHTPPKNYPCFSYSRHWIFEKDTVPLDLSGIIPTEICVSHSGSSFPLLKVSTLQKKLLKLYKVRGSAGAAVVIEQLGQMTMNVSIGASMMPWKGTKYDCV